MEPARLAPAPDKADLVNVSAGWLAELVRRGEVSAVEVVLAHLGRIAEVNPMINALVRVDGARALRAARAIDRRRSRGAVLGPLAGVPFVVKDNVDVRRQVTTSGSRAADDVVALNDALVVKRLRAAGAVLVGRANMDEFAMGASTRTSAYGATRNPWDTGRSPGGSSGGSAAAVAAGLAAFAIGTDTGGSIREPASQCGVVGVAPTPGLVPFAGVVPFAPELDRVGPLARRVSDAAAVLAVMAGRRAPRPSTRPLRVALVDELCGPANHDGVRDRLADAATRLRELGVEVDVVSVPDASRALGAYLAVTSVAAMPQLWRFVRTGRAGDEVVRRWEIGRALLGSAELADAVAVQARLRAQTSAALRRHDVLISPTMPTTAPTWDSLAGCADLTDPLTAPYTDCWTVLANLTGTPALSVPGGCSETDGMPVGVMLAGRPGADADLLALAADLEDGGQHGGAQAAISTLFG